MEKSTLGLKIDVDTYRGLGDGVPRLMRILGRQGLRATFFIAMGPDNSGKAVWRFFTKKGFFKKMLRSNAVGMYGFRTALSGTLLPARQIARSFPELFKELIEYGHEVGIHGYDHVRWHDRLSSMTYGETEKEIGEAFRIYRGIVGSAPQSSAAPGWTCTPHQLAIQDRMKMLYHSDSRGTAPFFPTMGGTSFEHLQIPTTLPTLDEILAQGKLNTPSQLIAYYMDRITSSPSSVLTVHAEAEGIGWAEWMDDLINDLKSGGVSFMPLREIALSCLRKKESIPRCELRMGNLPGRASPVAIQSKGVRT
jgi:undecaprenyl phosphate-alpha-L-ara4FN deformylase